MKTMMVFILTIAVSILGSQIAFAQETQSNPQPAGLKVFLDAKCNQCHSLEAKQVQKESGGFTKVKEKNVPPDLSQAGAKHDAEWFIKYLKKRESNEGIPHAKTFRRSEEELKTLAEWLATLK